MTTTNTVLELKGMLDELDESIAECEAEIAKVEENIKETTQSSIDIISFEAISALITLADAWVP